MNLSKFVLAAEVYPIVKTPLFIIALFFLAEASFAGQGYSRAIRELNEAIKNKSVFSSQKEARIASLKKIQSAGISPLVQYQVNKNLCREYAKYKIDTAVSYANQCLEVARYLKRDDLITDSRLQLANLYSSLGKFLESEQILNNIGHQRLLKPQRILYYESRILFFEHYTTNNYSEIYAKLIKTYRDSLLTLLDPGSVKYQLNLAQNYIYDGRVKPAQDCVLKIVKLTEKNYADYAMATYLLGFTHQYMGHTGPAIHYYALSAATDVRNAIKDHASLQNLALIFFNTGNIDLAYAYTKSAIDDAIFCNVKFRTLRMSEFYSIINTAYLEKEGKQKSQLLLYLSLISILSLILAGSIIYVYRQMKKVSAIKEELHLSSQRLAVLNQEISTANLHLSEMNTQLSDSNRVKEVYIAQFFDLCSAYINKLEDYRKTLNKKATEKRLDELFKMLRSNTVVEHEAEELYRIFDNIFLNLYPDFVRGFNELLLAEEQMTLKPGELLNTKLRIFALIRLGINDSVKIAAFLRCSLSTIYNYRTSVRNKAKVARDDFEKLVTRIG